MSEKYSMRVRDHGIVMFRIPSLAREVIDQWMEDLERLGQAWIEEEIALLLVDIRGAGITTPYITARLRETSTAVPASTRIRTAFLFDPGPPRILWERYLQGLGPLLGDKRAFTDEDEAISWLCEVL